MALYTISATSPRKTEALTEKPGNSRLRGKGFSLWYCFWFEHLNYTKSEALFLSPDRWKQPFQNVKELCGFTPLLIYSVNNTGLIIFQSTPKNKAVKQLICYRIPVCIYIYPAFHHLLSSHYFSNSSDNQGRPKYYIYMHQQFYTHLSFFGKFLNKSARITIYSWRTI